jgi:hypothetical protein
MTPEEAYFAKCNDAPEKILYPRGIFHFQQDSSSHGCWVGQEWLLLQVDGTLVDWAALSA